MGHLSPDEKQQLEKALKAIDEEEARMARLYAIGKISEFVWDGLWREWQDRRNQIRIAIESLQAKHDVHITNLDAALKIIAQVGIVYNRLERSDQKELLRHMVERVIIDPEGTIRLELRTPFAYLRDISDKVRGNGEGSDLRTKAKADSSKAIGLGPGQCSDSVLLCWGDRIRTYDSRFQRPVPYHLATPHFCMPLYHSHPTGQALPETIARAGVLNRRFTPESKRPACLAHRAFFVVGWRQPPQVMSTICQPNSLSSAISTVASS